MATFVLVHGAWHGGWCWQRVAERLCRGGHEVFTPTLTGLATFTPVDAQASISMTHILDMVNVMKWQRLTDVVLVGHSYGGMVISASPRKWKRRFRLRDARCVLAGKRAGGGRYAFAAGAGGAAAARKRGADDCCRRGPPEISMSTKRTALGSMRNARRSRSNPFSSSLRSPGARADC